MRLDGTKLAYAAGWALALFATTGASGCIVTGRKQFPVEDDVPTTLSARRSAFPTDEVIRLEELEPDADGGAGLPQELRLVVDVFDANPRQELEYRFLVRNGASGLTPPPECPAGIDELRACGTIAATGEIARPPLTIPVPTADLGNPEDPRCVRLDLLVAESFDALSPPPGRFLSELVWWVDLSSPTSSSAIMDTCPSGR